MVDIMASDLIKVWYNLIIYVGIDIAKLESFDKNSSIIGLESTTHYGENLY